MIVVPLGFVSDHVEVVWDLDHEALETAEALGMQLVRVPTPGTHPAFVERPGRPGRGAAARRSRRAPACGPPGRGRPLPPGCCANLRAPKPAVAGSDEASPVAANA